MTKITYPLRLALFGNPGAGKSTTRGMIADYCDAAHMPLKVIKLAEPLYEAQAAIYSIAGRPLQDFYAQDGELLNFLGSYLRKINSDALLERFAARVATTAAELNAESAARAIVVCDDLRRPDAEFVRLQGFRLVRVIADHDVCISRRSKRGDLTLGSATHPTEQGLDEVEPDHRLENNGVLDGLRSQVGELMRSLLG